MVHARSALPLMGIVTVCIFSFALVEYVHAQTVTCPAGAHPATAADVLLMQQANITGATVGMCWNPTDQNVGQTDAQAKQYLRSILCTNSNFGGAGPDGTISGLDSKFAVCAAKFIQSADSQMTGQVPLLNGGTAPLCVREGFRTVAQQNIYAQAYLQNPANGIACARGAACEHPRGIAIDINAMNTANDANYQKLWAIAPQFNLNFYLKARDKVHFVPTSTTCSGGGTGPNGTLPPTNFDFPQYYNGGAASQSPTLALLNGLRSMLGMAQPAPQYLQPQYIPQQQYMTPTTNANGTYTISGTTSSGVPYTTTYSTDGTPISTTYSPPGAAPYTTAGGPTGTNTSSGTPGSSPSLSDTGVPGSSSGAPSINDIFNGTSSTSNINTSTSTDEAINLINQFASMLEPSSTSAAATSGPATLNADLQNIQSANTGAGASNTAGNATINGHIPPSVIPPQEIAVNAPQTFAPPQILPPGDVSTYSPQQISLIQHILNTLGITLQTFLKWLQPFGNRAPTQQIIME